MGAKQNKLYEDMESSFVAQLGEDDKLVAPNLLSQLTRLVQLASNPILVGGINESPKWKAVSEILEYEELPAIVWTSFIKTAELMYQALSDAKYKTAMLTGETSKEQRHTIVEAFQAGELDVIIAHPAVGKFGLTLTAARTAIYLERNYNADDYYQSLHRVRRIGTKFSPHIIHLISTQINGNITVDHVINKVLENRKDSAVALTTGELSGYFGDAS
jgi:SNF2 family DNA or RNA helicase